jgi:hypothetical protein
MVCKLNRKGIDFFSITLNIKGRYNNKSSEFELLLKSLQQCTSTDSIIQQKQQIHMTPENLWKRRVKFTRWYP